MSAWRLKWFAVCLCRRGKLESLPLFSACMQELVLQHQMVELTDRLTCATMELERLRGDRQELGHQIRFMHDLLVMKLTGKWV